MRIVKSLYHNKPIGESVTRGMVGMNQLGMANTGMSYQGADVATATSWDIYGSLENDVLPAVRSKPLGIPNAKFVHGIEQLRGASRNHPALLGFNWDGGGGHFVVCVGATKADPSLFVILDPDAGIEYLGADSAVGNSFEYSPSYGAVGTIDPVGFIQT